jgi:hypothetical protein
MSVGNWKALMFTGTFKTALCAGIVYFNRNTGLGPVEDMMISIGAIGLGSMAFADFLKTTEILAGETIQKKKEDKNEKDENKKNQKD